MPHPHHPVSPDRAPAAAQQRPPRPQAGQPPAPPGADPRGGRAAIPTGHESAARGGYPGGQPEGHLSAASGGYPGAAQGGYPGGQPVGRPGAASGGQPQGYPGAGQGDYPSGQPAGYPGAASGGQPQGYPGAAQGGYPGAAPAGATGGRAAVPPGGPSRAVPGSGPGPAAAKPRSKRRIVAFSGLAVLILAALAAVFVVRPGPVDGWLAGGPTAAPATSATPEPTPTPVLAAAADGGTAPSAAGVKAAIEPLVTAKALGTKVNVSVLDAVTGEALYQRNADTMTTPASTTKLLTAATVLAARGPAYRLTTRAVAGSKPGEVVLIGGGDPTLAVNANGQFPGAARLDKLAGQVKKALGATAPTRVVIDTSLFIGPTSAVGWDPADISPGGQVAVIQSLMTNAGRITPVHHEVGPDPRYADPAMAAGKAFARQLGVTAAVTRGKAPATPPVDPSAAPDSVAPGTELGAVQSPPLVQVTDWMLQQSDNVIAESMGRQVALAAGKPASFDGATDAITAKLAELGLSSDEADLYDASGLSRKNGISPALLTDVLAFAASGKQPAVASLFGGLPVAGWSGTLRTRFVTPDPNQIGQGVVRAKTGTLSGVNTMAGELITKDGRLLVFAIMANGSGDAVTARAALDRVAAKLVSCGCG
jgi:serine-type D-Ala-D-Ala carboxypeptidase/endopeptidase (penicillin-binding protein 4)